MAISMGKMMICDDNPTLFSDHDKPKWGEILGEINHLTSLMVLKWFPRTIL